MIRSHQLATSFLLSGLIAGTAVPAKGQDTQKEQQPIRVKVERVDVGVIVTDSNGHFVDHLRQEHFHVLDDGIEQPLTNFATIDEPARVLLLIEAGPAVYLLEEGHLRAAYTLLNGLGAGDQIALVKYADVPQPILDFTTDKQAALAGLDRIQFNLGFGSLNLSSSLSKVLEWITATAGKKTVILLSTGVDTSADEDTVELLRRLSRGDVRTFAVCLAAGLQAPPQGKRKKGVQRAPNPNEKQFEEANQLLKKIAAASGGRAYFPVSSNEFEAVYAEIAQLVRHEYSLAFVPPAKDGKFHSVTVQASATGKLETSAGESLYRVSHRQGYVAPVTEQP
jgi:Ca-activated chloride channel homolog